MKIADIVGARPQFIKAAPILRAIKDFNQQNPNQVIEEILIHTGQHYDYEMSQVFFEELGLKSPDYNLEVGSGTHGFQTGEMLKRIEGVLLKEKPDMVVVYGDTNSTLAGALAAVKIHIPVAHVEAGLRSFNREMPEEHNRVLTDHCSDLLFCPTTAAVKNLKREGFVNILNDGKLLATDPHRLSEAETLLKDRSKTIVINTGDVMYDAVLLYLELAEIKSKILEIHDLSMRGYALCTIHRAENTNEAERMAKIFQGLEELASSGLPVVLPLHPRTKKALAIAGIEVRNVKLTNPVSYIDMLMLEKNARVILTDSGGVQKEAFFMGVPCVTLRDETEWVETVEAGRNVVAGCDPELIVRSAMGEYEGRNEEEMLYGDGAASERIIKVICARQV